MTPLLLVSSKDDVAGRFNTSYQLPLTGHKQTETFCVKTVPGMTGTRVLADWYVLFGHKAYLSLPEGWGGLCALVKLNDHMEINRYALLRHINLTKVLGTALAEEQKMIRMMVLQNRLTLDLITASQGDVCKLIGETCCTFIPDGYSTGGNDL